MEIWKSVVGYEGLYEVSDIGRVKSLKFGKAKILKPGNDGRGYLYVTLCKDGIRKSIRVHRLVANVFLPNPQNLETINHKDEDKTNNNVSNLEWMTRADNCRYGTHGIRAGLAHRKPVLQLDKSGNAVNYFSSVSDASRQTGIAQGHISSACIGERKTAGGFVWKYA